VFEIQYIVIGLVQGITEFLPISSSGHLILISAFTEWNDQGIFTDIAVHVGTLGAVVMYLRKYIKNIIIDFFSFKKNYFTTNHLWGIKIIIATIPALVVGFIVYEYLMDYLRNIIVIAWSSIIFGIILYFADRKKNSTKKWEDLNFLEAIIIGFFQVLAFIPGASRAGVTITGARILNINFSNKFFLNTRELYDYFYQEYEENFYNSLDDFKNDYIGRDYDQIINGDYYKKIGNLNGNKKSWWIIAKRTR